MRGLALAGLLLASTVVSAQAQDKRVESPFVSGGSVKMELGGADYTIRPGASDKIVVTYIVQEEEDLPRAGARIEAAGSNATIKVHGPHNGFQVVIEVPARTDLTIHLMAGDISVRGIRGNKQIESHAGDMNIDLGDPDDYASVEASVNAGDLEAVPFAVSKGGLFRSFRHTGPGEFRLHAHLGAGDLTLTSSGGGSKRDSFI